MNKLKPAILKALKVGGYIATSIVLLGAYTYLNDSESTKEFSKYLTDFGVPAALANMLISGIREYLRHAKPYQE